MTFDSVAATKSPIIFIGTGEHFNEFEPFEATSFVSRLLGYGDMNRFIKIIKDAGIDNQPELIDRLSKGVFTMRDMSEQFQNLLKMGPLSQVMSMIPGFSQEMMPKGKEREGQAKIKKFMCIMDSMTADELDHPNLAKIDNLPSRVARIARGSGRSIAEVGFKIDLS